MFLSETIADYLSRYSSNNSIWWYISGYHRPCTNDDTITNCYPRQYRKEDIEIARKALAWVGLSHLEEENVNRLSGGMQQKVYLAMALAQDAETILMDEPTTYLDISHQLRLMELAKKLASEGKAVVMILHDLPQALRTADWVEVLSEGRVIEAGTPSVVYQSGKLEEVFGVKIQHMDTETGRHYICEL